MRAYVIGGSGYTGREVLRILSRHPKVDDIVVSSTRFAGRKVSELHPSLTSELVFSEFDLDAVNASEIAFCCVPHRKSMEIVPQVTTKIVDLSADFRLRDEKVYEGYYGVKHACPTLLKESVYGLPEY